MPPRCTTLFVAGYMASVLPVILGAGPPSVVERNDSAVLSIDVPFDREGVKLPLADVLVATVQVDGSPLLTVKPPDQISSSRGWRLVEVSPAATEALGQERHRWRQSYTFEPLAPGVRPLQLQGFTVQDGPDNVHSLSWKAIPVRVVASIATPDLKSLRDPTVVESLAPLPEARAFPWRWLGAVVGGVAICVVARHYWRRRTRRQPVSAEQLARRELDRLLARRLPDQNKSVQFHALLANVVRRYLERKYGLPARRRTTEEFLVLVHECPHLASSERDFIQNLLVRCDLVKFAHAPSSIPECLAWTDQVRAFVAASRPVVNLGKSDNISESSGNKPT